MPCFFLENKCKIAEEQLFDNNTILLALQNTHSNTYLFFSLGWFNTIYRQKTFTPSPLENNLLWVLAESIVNCNQMAAQENFESRKPILCNKRIELSLLLWTQSTPLLLLQLWNTR